MQVSCQCETVQFQLLSSELISVYHCHCLECQKQSASAFGTSAIFPASSLFPLSSELTDKLMVYTRHAKEGGTVDCYFCKRCGVRMVHRSRKADGTAAENISIKGGCIDGLDWTKAEHIYVRSARVPIPEGRKTWRESPEP